MPTPEELAQQVQQKKAEVQQAQQIQQVPQTSEQLAQGLVDSRQPAGLAQDHHPSQDCVMISVPRVVAEQLARQQEIETATAGFVAFQLPSAPCTFHYADGTSDICPDGVLRTKEEDKIEELRAAVKAGNISILDPSHEKFARQIPPARLTQADIATQNEMQKAARVALQSGAVATNSGLSVDQLMGGSVNTAGAQ